MSKQNKKVSNHEIIVLEHRVTETMFEKKLQPLTLSRCVQKVFISKFYGEFSIYDQSNRLLGESKDSMILFNKSALQTDVSKVWYEAIAGYSS